MIKILGNGLTIINNAMSLKRKIYIIKGILVSISLYCIDYFVGLT
jgi:hypothetical protein